MVIDMSEQKLVTLRQLRQFLEGTAEVEFRGCGHDEERYRHIQQVLRRFGYSRLKRADKGVVVRYLVRTTGYSRQQITRLIKRASAGVLKKAYRAPKRGFLRRYTEADVALLAQTDTPHGTLSGPATRHLMQRAWAIYGDTRYERLAAISVAHLYNLRKSAPATSSGDTNGPRRVQRRCRSGSDAHRPQRAVRDSSASKSCIRAIRTGSRGCITSMPSTASLSGSWWRAARS
jgi:hypothetical protein